MLYLNHTHVRNLDKWNKNVQLKVIESFIHAPATLSLFLHVYMPLSFLQ
jgi:hypothetical protein